MKTISMNYKKYFFISLIIILSIIIIKNIILLSEFQFIAHESLAYNIGSITGMIIKIIGFMGLIKLILNSLKYKPELLKI